MNLPLAHSLALSLHSTHPLSCRFLAGLNESFPTRCGRSCGMPFLLENRPKTVKKISRGTAPDPLSLPISGRAPRQSVDPPPRPRVHDATSRRRIRGHFRKGSRIGSTISRANHEESLHEAETTGDNPTVEALTFTTLLPNGTGGFENTPAGCTHRHYIHKTLGSVARHFARAQEVVAILGAHYPFASLTIALAVLVRSSCGTTSKTKSVGPPLETAHDAWWLCSCAGDDHVAARPSPPCRACGARRQRSCPVLSTDHCHPPHECRRSSPPGC